MEADWGSVEGSLWVSSLQAIWPQRTIRNSFYIPVKDIARNAVYMQCTDMFNVFYFLHLILCGPRPSMLVSLLIVWLRREVFKNTVVGYCTSNLRTSVPRAASARTCPGMFLAWVHPSVFHWVLRNKPPCHSSITSGTLSPQVFFLPLRAPFFQIPKGPSSICYQVSPSQWNHSLACSV